MQMLVGLRDVETQGLVGRNYIRGTLEVCAV